MTGQQATKTLSDQEHHAMLKSMMLVSIISADNDEFSEEIKQEVISRLSKEDKYGSRISSKIDWDYVFEPLGLVAEKCAKIMKSGE